MAQPNPKPPASSPETGGQHYYLRWHGAVSGPFTRQAILADLSRGKLSRLHQVSRDKNVWKALRAHPDFSSPDALPTPAVTPSPAPEPPSEPAPRTVTVTARAIPSPVKPASPAMPKQNALNGASNGAGARGATRPATMGRRFGAVALDLLVLLLIALITQLSLQLLGRPNDSLSGVQLAILAIAFLYVSWLYSAVLESCSWQATLGKRALGLRVESAGATRLDFGFAAQRAGLKLISALPAMAGLIVAFRDDERRAMHDRITHTRVVEAAPSMRSGNDGPHSTPTP